jgi:hypothetical protein
MRKFVPILLVSMMLGGLLAGCGGTPTIDVSGKTFLNSQEEADSRTIQFNPDGTFLYSVVTTERTWRHTGTYKIADGKVTLTFVPAGDLTEFAGKTVEYKIDGKLLVDPDGSRWMSQ